MPAAFDICVVSPLNSNVLSAVGATADAASEVAELRNHTSNDRKCAELGWVSIPLVAESYRAWNKEAQQYLPRCVAIHNCMPKFMATFELYARLNICLMWANSYIASLSSSGAVPLSQENLIHAVELFNSLVPSSEAVSMEEVLTSRIHQKVLSNKIDNHLFNILYEQSSAADRAHLLSVSSPHAASWVSIIPLEGLGLHLQPSEFQVAIKWWLGLDTSCGSICPLCPGRVLDPLGHHALTCKRGGDVVTRHNKQRDTHAETCCRAHLSVKVEAGSNLTKDHSHTRPANILVPNWSLGKLAAFDLSVMSPLNSNVLLEAGLAAGQAARATEQRKHDENGAKCIELRVDLRPHGG
ncbi:hypothetical protein EMCRGX_G025764 [Ephydatia muelleri]